MAEGRLEEAEKLFNCKIEFNGVGMTPREHLARLMSGESKNDVMAANNVAFWPLTMNALYNPDTVGVTHRDSLFCMLDTLLRLRYGGKRYVFSAETTTLRMRFRSSGACS